MRMQDMDRTNQMISYRPTKKKKLINFGQNLIIARHSASTWITLLLFTIIYIQSACASPGELKAVPLSNRPTAVLGSNTSLACSASVKPILCLWKTPYGHVYTLSEGVFAESGRLKHEVPSEAGGQGCGIQIVGVEARDQGDWQCEVGGLIRDAFETDTATISLEVKKQSETSQEVGHTSRQEVGNDVILHCNSEREVHLCRWKTPYLNTYIVGEGIYVERGRIQWLGKDPNFDCTIRVAKLDLRDAGTWVCEIGTSTIETFQVQTKEFVIDIETPLKLSAPTSLMQNANTDATLVCHANKPYDDCLWTTPYGETYSFSDSTASHEDGRIGYFGFAATDCGVIVRNVGSRDNGDWLCQLHSRNGDIFQNATDIVPLYADLTTAAKPRAIPDYDYDKKLSSNSQYDDDYQDYSGDFSRLENEAAATQQAPATKVQLFPDSSSTKKLENNNRKQQQQQQPQRTTPTVFSTTTTRSSGQDQSTDSDIELTKIPTTTLRSAPSTETTLRSTSFSTQRSSLASTKSSTSSPTTPVASPLSIFRDEGVELSGVNALELELLSRISGTRRDSRPIRIGSGQKGDQEAVNIAVEFESSRTDIPTVVEQVTERLVPETTTPDSRERMRLREIQRIRNERKKTAMQREKDDLEDNEEIEDVEEKETQKEVEEIEKPAPKNKQEQEAERLKQMAIAREEEKRRQQESERKRAEERQKQIEEQRKREEMDRRKKAEEEEKKRKEEEKKKAEEEAKRKFEIAKQEEAEAQRKAETERIERDKEIERLQQINAVIEEEKKRQQETERKRTEERNKQLEEHRKQEAEARRKKAEEEEKARKELKEREEKQREEERQRAISASREEEKKRQREADRKRLAERQKQLEEQRKRDEEDKRKKAEEEEKERIEKEEKEKEERLRIEAEKKEEAERLKIEAEQNRVREEQKRRQQMEEERKRKREEELKQRQETERRRKVEEEKRQAALERRRQEERDKARKEEEERKKAEEEKLQKEREQKQKEEEEKLARELEEKKKKDEEEKVQKELEQKEKEEKEKAQKEFEQKQKENQARAEALAVRKMKEEDERKRHREESLRREEDRRRRLEAQQKKEETERAEKAEADRLKKLEQETERQKEVEKQKQEDLLKIQREEERRKALDRKREEDKQRELQQRRLESDAKKNIEEIDEDIKEDSTTDEEDQGGSSSQEFDLPNSNSNPESPRSLQSNGAVNNLLPEKGRENERKHCVLPAFPSNGNVTCGNLVPEGSQYRLIYGQSCLLTCKAGFVSLELRESRCFNGRMTQRLECVPPDALLIVGGRSDTYGVLSSVELVTGRGVCRGAVPPLPTMRWRMIAHAVDRERVIACGGVNIFGDPKADCWVMGFNPDPFWSEGPRMNVARDAAAWAQEGNFLFVMGGSLGKFSGYTDSVEMYSVESGNWLEGPKMSSSRYSHCAVGLGNGSIIVTGGYGGLNMVERLDVSNAQWVSLPELNPVRAQHGCALVDLHGEHGVIVVGGDSGGTRLKDVRFLPIGPKHTEWRKVAEMLTARWGRPGVGIVGGRITVAAGWDGVKDLDTVEYYDEVKREWRRQASRLQTERRWPSSTPISLSLFPKCAQRRE